MCHNCFQKNDMIMKNRIETSNDDMELNIIKSEFIMALNELKKGKAPGIDHIPSKLLKNIGKNTECKVFEVIEKIYRDGNISGDFIKSKSILILKKGNYTECLNNQRTINLSTYVSEILLIIIKNRIRKKIKDKFGFRQGTSTRKAILALALLVDRVG